MIINKASVGLSSALDDFRFHGVPLFDAWLMHYMECADDLIKHEYDCATHDALNTIGTASGVLSYEEACSYLECIELLELAIDIALYRENKP
jgi:hypothetical protein